ncbi:MAG: DUF6298 domain-containing protein, partial [Pirellulales bacterium]
AAVVRVAPGEGDDTARIQAAIDEVASRQLDENGFRGAVELAAGEFHVAGQLRIAASGIVLRGAGAGEGGTTIVATGPDRRTLLRVSGQNDRRFEGAPYKIVDDYVPVGATKLTLSVANELKVGDTILVIRPSTAEWIKTIGANAFGVGWRPGSRDIGWERVVTAIDGETITLDAPITTALDKQFGGGTVAKAKWPGRVERVGVEDLRLVSQPSSEKPLDEDHAWHGVTIENAQNAWVRRVEFEGFAGGAVALWESTKWVTVEDCISLAPVSEVGGFRRHAFFTQGQLTLFLRCWSEHGRHDFAVGHCAPGPNAFVNCRTQESLADSGPLESWASGVLYDNVRIDGNALNLINRWTDPPGAGWSAANCVLWQCRASAIACFRPPTANNWAIGCWAAFSGDGTFESPSDFVRPLSLYQAQLVERVGDAAAKRVDPILGEPIGATNPTLEEAAKFVTESREPAKELVDVIRERMNEHTNAKRGLGLGTGDAGLAQPPAPSPQPPKKRLTVHNGWLVADDKLVTGGRFDPLWWRGSVRPDEVQQLGQAITRFVPGRVGTGFTDDLAQVAIEMQRRGEVAYDHHYGLWYERRRDDHTMGRQMNGDVAAPFYEQPFARTGEIAKHGTAWDGLSKYDLTRFNLWYWNRLHDFARLCDDRGLVLLHENYFQHNILEAGAHWADCPWRPANNINDTGLPEPPPYVGDKRQFMAPAFYDITNPKLRALHRGYIRQCLDAFADTSNVIQLTSAEYSGPLEFTQFWLDTIGEWKREQIAVGREQGVNSSDSLPPAPCYLLVALSAPKDVQDAILADPKRAKLVDVIDIRYWAYTADDELYAPQGGQNLAPRQHLRQTRQKPGGAAAIVKAVREYRERYPVKAIIYNADENCPSTHDGWATLIAGGSLADVKLPQALAAIVPSMRSVDGVANGDAWCLANDSGEYLVYSPNPGESIELMLPTGRYAAKSIQRSDGTISSTKEINVDGPISLPADSRIVWLSRQE